MHEGKWSSHVRDMRGYVVYGLLIALWMILLSLHFFANAFFMILKDRKNPRILGDENYLITQALQLFTLAKVSIIV